MIDLNDLNLTEKAEQGADMVLEHPVTGEPLSQDGKPITIKLAGTDSSAYRKKQRTLQNNRLQKLSRGKKILGSSEAEDCDLLAACTLGWSGITEGGKAIPHSHAAAAALYIKHGWIREQVDLFIADRANFFTAA